VAHTDRRKGGAQRKQYEQRKAAREDDGSEEEGSTCVRYENYFDFHSRTTVTISFIGLSVIQTSPTSVGPPGQFSWAAGEEKR
jgi:hypothetical protein